MNGLGILNVGAGDTKLTFDPSKPEEMKRAARIVSDMIRRGYVILVEVRDEYGPPGYQRVYEFKEDTCEYIIADDREESDGRSETKTRGRGRRRAISAARASGVAVARTAGG